MSVDPGTVPKKLYLPAMKFPSVSFASLVLSYSNEQRAQTVISPRHFGISTSGIWGEGPNFIPEPPDVD